LDNQWNSENPQDGIPQNEPAAAPVQPGFSGFSPYGEYESPPRNKHSGLGIASFSIFGGMAVLFVILLIAMIARITSKIDITADPEDITDTIENMPELMVLSFLMFGSILGNLIGLVLGIIGLIQKERKKIFAILGTVFNGLVIGFVALILIIGVLAAFSA
jgi:hypothetical protein